MSLLSPINITIVDIEGLDQVVQVLNSTKNVKSSNHTKVKTTFKLCIYPGPRITLMLQKGKVHTQSNSCTCILHTIISHVSANTEMVVI